MTPLNLGKFPDQVSPTPDFGIGLSHLPVEEGVGMEAASKLKALNPNKKQT